MSSGAIWAAAATGGIILVGSLIVLYKFCRAKKRGSKRIQSSLRHDERERRISSLSISQNISDEPGCLTSQGVIVYIPPMGGINTRHKMIAQRFSEPVIPSNGHEDLTEDSRPYSDISGRQLSFQTFGNASDQRSSPDEAKTQMKMSDPLFKIDKSYRKEGRVLGMTESKDSGVLEDFPDWSMEAEKCKSTSATNLIETTKL